jgi:hypothetical protein
MECVQNTEQRGPIAETAYEEDQIADSWKKVMCILCVRYWGTARVLFLPQQLCTMILSSYLRQAATLRIVWHLETWRA